MKLKDFIEAFMQNNEVVLENKDNYEMHYKYQPEENEKVVLMDWECKFTNVCNCEIISVKNVIRKDVGQHITLKIDTDLKDFAFEADKVSLTNAPLWLYNKMHGTTIPCCDAVENPKGVQEESVTIVGSSSGYGADARCADLYENPYADFFTPSSGGCPII